jgi:hypothetical protein
MSQAVAVKEETKPRSPIAPDRVKHAEFARQEFVVNTELGTTLEELQDPGYWAHISQKLQIFDHIECRAEDGQWVAHFIVVQAEKNWARVVLDRLVNLRPAGQLKEVPSEKHRVEWKGGQYKYAVIRTSDSKMVKAEFDDKSAAQEWLRDYERRT